MLKFCSLNEIVTFYRFLVCSSYLGSWMDFIKKKKKKTVVFSEKTGNFF